MGLSDLGARISSANLSWGFFLVSCGSKKTGCLTSSVTGEGTASIPIAGVSVAGSSSGTGPVSKIADISASASSDMASTTSSSLASASGASSAASAVGLDMASLCASAADALLMSIRHPVSLAASLAFCPSLPIASESCLSGTTTVAISSSSFNSTLTMLAGLRALAIKIVSSGFHITTSIFSPCNSFTTFCILMPRSPTQQPTGSIPS